MLSKYLALFCLILTAHALPQLKLGRTTLIGRDAGTHAELFGGIPFAEPPIGSLRLRPPVLKTRLNVPTFNATDYGKGCLQPLFDPSDVPDFSEDCLTINVYRPKGIRASEKLPVMFWTYGGAYVIGTSSMYDGSDIVRRSVERVSELKESPSSSAQEVPWDFPRVKRGLADDRRSLNLGIQDQIAALEWVQANIEAFGGDKNKVIFFGESSGSMMTGHLYLSPGIINRFARGVILESGQPNSLPTYPAARNERFWQGFVQKVESCASVAASGSTFPCLWNATTEEITTALLQSVVVENIAANLVWTPAIDTGRGSVYPDLGSRLLAKGNFARLPLMLGTTLDEGTIFARSDTFPDQELKDSLVALSSPPIRSLASLNTTIDRLLRLYPENPSLGSPYGTGDEVFGLPPSYKRHASILGDLTFDATRRMWSQVLARSGVNTYTYLFTDPQPDPVLGVRHAAEIPYVYGQLPAASSPASINLSAVMMDYWIAFAVSLNPNDRKGVKRSEWPRYTPSNRVLMQFDGGNTTIIQDDYRKEQMSFIIEHAVEFHH